MFTNLKAYEYPKDFLIALNKIKNARRMKLNYDTHHDGNNYELMWGKNNIRNVIDYHRELNSISVVFYRDTFPRSPGFVTTLYRFIGKPNFIQKREWEKLEELSLDEVKEYYEKLINNQSDFADECTRELNNQKTDFPSRENRKTKIGTLPKVPGSK